MAPLSTSSAAAMRKAFDELHAVISTLPEEQRLDAFLHSCTSLLQVLDCGTVARVRDELARRYPEHAPGSPVMMLLEGNLAWRELVKEE